jgi:hypothetical protein
LFLTAHHDISLSVAAVAKLTVKYPGRGWAKLLLTVRAVH